MTDILITTPDAKFGQPEITLGIIPGGGGTQRLASVIGKARTMDLVLTNRWITGAEAGEWGLASRVTKEGESVVEEAVKVGDVIAGFGAVATQAGKEAVNAGKSDRTSAAGRREIEQLDRFQREVSGLSSAKRGRRLSRLSQGRF
jgi:enoyl-CoA hydratase